MIKSMQMRRHDYHKVGNKCPRRFFVKREIEQGTQDCLQLLERGTNVKELLRAANGRSWVAKRAIALYNLGIDSDYHNDWWRVTGYAMRRYGII